MKLSSILNISNVKVLIYLYDKEARYSDLLREVVPVRSTLSYVLSELIDEGLVKKTIVSAKPIRIRYSLTDKGKQVAEYLILLKNILVSRGE